MLLKEVLYSLSRNVRNKYLTNGYSYSTLSTFKEEKIKVMNYEINYLRVGRGPHQVFLTPGMFGTIWTNYRKQIEGFDLDQFNVIVWDPPGFGKSVDLKNKEHIDLFDKAADVAYEFLMALGIPSCSALGWSLGGYISFFLAARYPHFVNKLVSWGSSTFFYPHEMEYFKNVHSQKPTKLPELQDLENWSKSSKEEMIKLYGESSFINKIDSIVKKRQDLVNNRVCNQLRDINCPIFLLHGANDQVMDIRHVYYLNGLLKNSRIFVYPDGRHNLHIQYADDFNKRVQDFLLEL